jgi:hypothetical protein
MVWDLSRGALTKGSVSRFVLQMFSRRAALSEPRTLAASPFVVRLLAAPAAIIPAGSRAGRIRFDRGALSAA